MRSIGLYGVKSVSTFTWQLKELYLGKLVRFAGAVLLGAVLGWTASPSFAITAEVAKRCGALMAKQFPLREPGNPAAGSAKGSGRDRQAFFNKCVANGGKMEDASSEK